MKLASWKTTAAGIAAIVTTFSMAASAQLDADPITVPDWNAAVAALILGVGLLFARDNNVTSEQAGAGAKPK